MSERLYLYPVWVRLWHWTNAILCLLLIVSGVSLQYSNPEYPLIRFDVAVTMHNIAGILLTLSYIGFVIGNAFTPNGKYYKTQIKGLFESLKKQAIYYAFGIFTHAEKPYPVTKERKFNPLQKVTYVVTMYFFLPLIFVTGWGLLFPETNLTNVFGISGLHLTALLHGIIGFFVSVFMFVHIYFCTIGTTTWSNFKSMIDGWH